MSNMLKEKCKKWEQKYETVSDDLNFITFFQEMSPKTFASIEIGSNAVRMIVVEKLRPQQTEVFNYALAVFR
jgi:hypothetical protein